MAITTKAGEEFLVLRNENRAGATPPIVFPDFDLSNDFTWSVWVKPLGVRGGSPIDVSLYTGIDGSRIFVGHNGYNWAYSSRYGSSGEATIYFNDVVYNRWTLLVFAKHGNNISIGYGLQDTDDLNPAGHEVPITIVVATTTDIITSFNQFSLTVGHNQYISNFKFWHTVLSLLDLQSQTNRFDVTGGNGVKPFWSSPLRTPGDLSNIVNPYTGPNWAAGHAFTSFPDSANLVFERDPAHLETTPSPTWIYPVIPTASSSFNPGTSPLVPTTYDSLQFWDFADKGSLSNNDSDLLSILYLAWPHFVGSGYAASDSWGLYKDETGAKVVSAHSDPANRFEQDTGVVIPPGAGGLIKISTMYAWQYSAQFTWQPRAPQGPTATQAIDYLYLYVIFIGIPTGIPHLPVQNLTGLFAISRLVDGPVIPGTDTYNRGTKLAIPAPTIRTAYLGE